MIEAIIMDSIKRRNKLYSPGLKMRARELRNNMTLAEKKLWLEYLRYFPLKVLRQKPIKNYIVDFYCPKLNLVIEVDGETHFEKNDLKYDQNRTDALNKLGLKVIRFWNYEITEGFESVCERIENEMKQTSNPPSPLC